MSLCPDFWEIGGDGKACIKGGKQDPKNGDYELEVKDIGCNKDAEYSCPVQIIHVEED